MLEVYVASGFRRQFAGRGIEILQDWQPAPARELLCRLGLDPREVGLICVDGKKVDLDTVIHKGKVEIWPLLSGG